MAGAPETARNVRILHLAFLAAPAVLFFAVATLPVTAKPQITFLPALLAVLALGEVGIATAFRAKLLRPAVAKLEQAPGDARALAQWQRGQLLSMAFATTVTLYGVVVRVMGFSWNIAAWFFVAGFLLLLWWTPRLVLPSSPNVRPPSL